MIRFFKSFNNFLYILFEKLFFLSNFKLNFNMIRYVCYLFGEIKLFDLFFFYFLVKV